MKKLVSLRYFEENFAMPTSPSVSVIIPTYNRKTFLRETLESLAEQTYPRDCFDVIVVDDGSTDDTAQIVNEAFPFALRYFAQVNQGDAAARNLGARQTQADILVFLDDDILVEAEYLDSLVQAHDGDQNRIVSGTCHLWPAEITSFAQNLYGSAASAPLTGNDTQTVVEVPFRDAYSNNMSIRRDAYFKIGMMQGLDFAGSSMWCDLDFNYRAYKQGFRFFCSTKAVCWHRDYTVRNLDTYKKRMRTAAYRAIVLFQRYPELLAQVPMFYDKTPIQWGRDPLELIARKLIRAAASSGPVIWSMERIVHALEKRESASSLLSSLYRYIIGGYVYQGYRAGLSEFGQIKNVADPLRSS